MSLSANKFAHQTNWQKPYGIENRHRISAIANLMHKYVCSFFTAALTH